MKKDNGLSEAVKIPYAKLKVLLVDPQRPFQIMMKGILTNFGVVNIDFCESGEAAVRQCRAKEYDLLLVEYNLGNKNGRQLLEELRTLKLISPDCLFFIVSAENERAIVLGTMEMAPDDYIVKPFSQRLLDVRLSKAWVKRRTMSGIYHSVEKKDYQQAIARAKQLIKAKDQHTPFIMQMMTELMCLEKQYDEVITNLTAILKKRTIPWATISLARAYLGLNELEKAETLLKNLLANNSSNVAALDLLAEVQLEGEQVVQAKNTLKKSIDLSPYSMKRHQTMVNIASQDNDLLQIKESYGQLLNLSRRSVHAGTNNLLNYTRSIIDMATLCEEPKDFNKIQNELNTTLHHAKQEEGRNLNYHFAVVEGVVQAQYQSAKGESLLSKKTLMLAIHSFNDENDQWSLPDELAIDTCITLVNVSDFELVDKFISQLSKNNIPPPRILEQLNGEDLAQQKAEFKQITRQGIEAYSANNNTEALELFTQALNLSPVNSGAILNVIQAQIKLMQSHRRYIKTLMVECKDSFRTISGMKLSTAHQNRLDKLKLEFDELVKRA